MRVLFFTLIKMTSINDRGIYADMVKEFVKRGHHVDYYFPLPKVFNTKGTNYSLNSIRINQKTQKTKNFFGKFLSFLFIDLKFSNIINNLDENYDLLILVTPSIFQTKIIKTFKKRFPNSKTLLLLKDIFPDNALDLGILNHKFPKVILYYFFKRIENLLYKSVDKIGVMTELNRNYIYERFPFLRDKIFLSPNSIEYYLIPRVKNRKDLNLREDKIIITFVGNIGLPQDPKALKCLINNSSSDIFFIVIGSGALDYELKTISADKFFFMNESVDQNMIDQYLINSNYGLIFLNSKFNVPNFPSKLLSYLNAGLPILAVTNYNNDLKILIEKNIIQGKWFYSKDLVLSNKKLEFSHDKFTYENKIFNIADQIEDILSNFKILR